LKKEQFIGYIRQPELLNESTLPGIKEMIEDYPFFPAVRMLYLRNLLNINSYKFESELTKHAIFIPDRSMLFRLLDLRQKPEECIELLPYDSDIFDNFEDQVLADEEHVIPDELQFQYIPPFQLTDEEPEKPVEKRKPNFDLIDKFISKQASTISVSVPMPVVIEDNQERSNELAEDFITETLAAIYQRQGLYEKAVQSYEKLSLKFPEKNAYFAGQIENIKKLISKE
jgi:hypothetical protein